VPNSKKSVRKKEKAKRYRLVKVTAKVSSVSRSIESDLGLPRGSVALILPSGRKKKGNTTIQSLLDSWD
jgi:hypothetical protein